MNEDYHKKLDDFVDQLRDEPKFGSSLADYYYNSGVEHWMKNSGKLISNFEVAVRIKPHPMAYHVLGLSYVQVHRYDEAIKNFKKVLDYVPNFYPAIEELAQLQHEHHLLGRELEFLPEIPQEFFKEVYSRTKPGKLKYERITHGGHVILLKYKYQGMYGFETDYGDICAENVTVTETSKGFMKHGKLYDVFDKYSLSCVDQVSMGSVPIRDGVAEGRKKKFMELTNKGNVGKPNEALQRWTKNYIKRLGYKFHSGYHESDSYEDFVNGKNFAQRFSWLHAIFLPAVDMHKDNQISVLLRTPK